MLLTFPVKGQFIKVALGNGDTIHLSVMNASKLWQFDSSIELKPINDSIATRMKYRDTANIIMTVKRATDSINSLKTSLTNYIQKSDSASMLLAYLVAINARLKNSDTSIMLSPYLTALGLRVKISDTSSMLSPYLTAINARIKYTDSSSMLSAYRTAINGKQSTISLGATSQYLRGDLSLATFPTALSSFSNDVGYITTATKAKADNSTLGVGTFDSSYFADNGSGLISFSLKNGTGTVSANAVTINRPKGKISYASPNILAAGVSSITFSNSFITSTSNINVGINGNGSNLTSVNCYIKSQTAGSCVINIQNLSLLNLFNSNMVIDYTILN